MMILEQQIHMLLLVCVASAPIKNAERTTVTGDMTSQSELTKLFNTEVKTMTRVERGFDNRWMRFLPHVIPSNGNNWRLRHEGVLVETVDDKKWLVHKPGNGAGTVVVDAKHMSDRWESYGQTKEPLHTTIGDLVERGGEKYQRFLDNCHHTADRIMEEPTGFWHSLLSGLSFSSSPGGFGFTFTIPF